MIDRVHLRLCVWAEDVVGGCGAPSGGSLLGSVAITKPHRRKRKLCPHTGELLLPQLTVEAKESRVSRHREVGIRTMAMEVDSAVLRLSDELQDVVRVFYFEGDLAAKVRAKRLGMSVATMYRRRDAAHVLLDAYLHGKSIPSAV
ncbi:MAG: hypothetical protein ACRBBW_03875 [Cellvibrionaceae bacterium]